MPPTSSCHHHSVIAVDHHPPTSMAPALRSSYTYTIALPLFLWLIFPGAAAWRAPPQVPAAALDQRPCNAVSAILVFGDSTVDPGNNNYLATAFKSNFPPYGRDFLGHLPTGRFTNGRLTTDFIVSYVGIKDAVPPYLDWTLSATELETGVSFASAASGYDPLTAQMSGVIPVLNQLDYFRDYLAKLDQLVGRRRSEDIIRSAVYVVSAGTNDFVVNYFTIPVRQQMFNLQDYQNFLLQNVRKFLQGIQDLGAQKIFVVGLPPMGCLPIVITVNGKGGYLDRGCIEDYNAIARDFNDKLQKELKYLNSLQAASDGGQIFYVDIYDGILNLVREPSKFGFAEAMDGCCGTGLVEASFLCNLKSIVCDDASKYVFWDSIHPTEKTYFILFNSLRQLIDRACAGI